MATLDNVKELIALAREGKFIEAIERFYAEDATMQENLESPRVGLAALLENERKVLAAVPDIHLEGVASFVVDGDRAAINWVFAYTDRNGRKIQLDEVAYQEWRNGKIIRERFYYDPAQRLRGVLDLLT
ncbi:MAG: polyketide cyclase, partial [Acidobacteria bacterium]